jgi:hypothetical protein
MTKRIKAVLLNWLIFLSPAMDKDTIVRRAQALAQLLKIEYRENLEWKCRALYKTDARCTCPKCMESRNDKKET